MGPAQDDVGGHLADDFRLVHMVGQASVSGPSVRDDAGTGGCDRGDEGLERGSGEVGDLRETNAARLTFGREFHRAGNEHLALRAAALTASGRVVLMAQSDLGLVNFDDVLEKASLGIDHGTAQLRQEQPGALVAAQAQLGLQLQGGDPVGVAGHDMDRREPGLQRQMAAMHDRACGHGRLPPAGRALPGERLGLQQPSFRAATARADKAVRPPATRQIVGAGRIIWKSRLELGAGERAVMFPAARHARTLSERVAQCKRRSLHFVPPEPTGEASYFFQYMN